MNKDKVFRKIVNPLLLKYMLDPFKYKGSCIAAGIPIKYLKYFKLVSRGKDAKKIRYRYRGWRSVAGAAGRKGRMPLQVARPQATTR